MKSKALKLIKQKWIVRFSTIVILIALTCLTIFAPGIVNATSNSWLVVVTIIYAYLTYEILVSTRQSRNIPHIYVEFAVVSKIEPFVTEQASFLKRTEKFNQLQQDSARADYDADVVFVKVQNIGEITAVEVCLKIKYERKNFGDTTTIEKDIPFGILKKDEISVALIDVFQSPAEADYLKIVDGWVEYNDINGQHLNDGPMWDNFAQSAKVNLSSDARLSFSLKS